jgi:hypothetical protein
MENQSSSNPQAARPSGMINIRYGVYNQPANLAGKSVSEIREQYSKIWNIPNDAVAMVGRERLDENAVIQPGQNVEFFRRAGEKG